MSTAKVLAKGQIVIPKEIREKMKIKPGDTVEIIATEKGAAISRMRETYTETFKGVVKGRLSLKELENLYDPDGRLSARNILVQTMQFSHRKLDLT